MCILFLAINQHPDYPLIICANRDEFHARPTKAAHFWPDSPDLLAGRDLQANGTWLGLTVSGRFAALTNLRRPNEIDPNRRSRGELVTQALLQPDFDGHWLQAHAQEYNPFNLIYGTLDNLVCFDSATNKQTRLSDGFHAISNGAMDDVWPKMARGEQQLERLIRSGQPLDIRQFLEMMTDDSKAPDTHLPDTGIGLQWERLLSSIFITSSDYGTRSTTIVRQHQNDQLDFVETTYDREGESVNQEYFSLTIKKADQ